MDGASIVSGLLPKLALYAAAGFGVVCAVVALYCGMKWASHLSYMAGGVGSEWGGSGGYRDSDGTEGDDHGITSEGSLDGFGFSQSESEDRSEEFDRDRASEEGRL